MIAIKTNMDEMPDSCIKCSYGRKYGFVGETECKILGEYFTNNVEPPYKERPDECPLIFLDNDLTRTILETQMEKAKKELEKVSRQIKELSEVTTEGQNG